MAWTFTLVASGLAGDGAQNLGAFYEAGMIDLTTIPEWYGRTGLLGRPVFFGVGYVAPSFATGPTFPRVSIQMRNQVVMPPAHTISRLLYWLPPGVIASVYYGVWA